MSIKTYIKSHAVLATTVAIVAVLGMIIAGRVASRTAATDTSGSNTQKVTLVDVRSFRDDASRITADGTVESVSQADLRSQVSAPVAAVNVTIGSTVYAGQTLIILQNADIRAQLDQARAALQVARGQYSTGGLSLISAEKTAIDRIRAAYVAADEVVRVQLDQFLFNASGGNQSLFSHVSDREQADRIRDLRLDLTTSLRDWKRATEILSASSSHTSITTAIVTSRSNLETVSALLDEISDALNEAIQNVSAGDIYDLLSGWKVTVTAARTSIISATAGLTAAEGSLNDAQATYTSPAQAQVSVAEAGVKNLEAQLAKTTIVSPISGKIAALPLRVGELASPGQHMATVIGGGGLHIKVYVSGEDLSRVKTGASVLIQNSIAGTVTAVSPSVSQINKKAEVTVTITEPARSALIIGQSVTVSIEADTSAQAASPAAGIYRLPIQNVKIIPGDAFVFSVNEQSEIVAHPVTLGTVQGDFVEVTSGLDDSMKIVTPVYELEAGQKVTVR